MTAMGECPSETLRRASRQGSTTVVEQVLQQGCNINEYNEHGWAPLHIACQNGHRAVVEMLLNKGCDVNASCEKGWTALHIASMYGHTSIVQLLLERGSNIGACNENGSTSLHKACANGHTSVVEVLLDSGSDVNVCTKQKVTPLHVASKNGHTPIVAMLLNRGCDVNPRKEDGTTPLCLAISNKHASVVEVLLAKGCDMNAALCEGATPLFIAAQNDDIQVVELLLNKGCDRNACCGNGWTALHIASQEGHTRIVQQLLNGECNVDARLRDGSVPLCLASQYGHRDVVQLLLDNGCDIDAYRDDDCTALHIASKNGHSSVVELLLDRGCDKDAFNNTGWTAAHLAAGKGHTGIVRLLVMRGMDILLNNENEDTPLHVAAENGRYDTVRYIVEEISRESVHKKGYFDTTPRTRAIDKEHTAIAQYLSRIERGESANHEEAGPLEHLTFHQQLWDYKICQCHSLGRGVWGEVYPARHVHGGPVVALKKVTWRVSMEELSFDPRKEVDAYRTVPKHKNIVRFIDNYTSHKLLIIVLELCEKGDLEGYFVDNDPGLAVKVDLMEQACCGLLHLHSQSPPMVHRDIKPANLLLKEEGGALVLKIADFGTAKRSEQNKLKTLAGTIDFMAPDVLPSNTEVSYTKEVDVFSLGIVYQAMLRFKRGDSSLKPILEGKPDCTKPIPTAMQNAAHRKEPIPMVVVMHDDDEFYISRIKHLIKHMARYKVKDRIQLSLVHEEITSIKENLK